MKAYRVYDKKSASDCATVVFAENRAKAKAIAMSTDTCEYAEYLDIRATRVPSLDKYYRGKDEMDWYNANDLIALVKEAGFVCSYEIDDPPCKECPAKKWCNRYEPDAPDINVGNRESEDKE
jgi:hypothetical protein